MRHSGGVLWHGFHYLVNLQEKAKKTKNQIEKKKMTKTLQQDISQNKYEKKKILKHEDREEISEENKSLELKRKVRRLAEEDK